MNYLEALRQRYAVKKFDKTKKIPSQKLNNILEAGRLSASSSGLQPYEIIVVQSEDLLGKLHEAFFNPSQISTCAALLVVVARKGLDAPYLDGYFQHISKTREVSEESLQPFRSSIEGFAGKKSQQDIQVWNEKQGYILLGTLLTAAAIEQVDGCPMEGFRSKKLAEILQIDLEKYSPCVTLALGYRAEDDHNQKLKKVRKPEDKLFRFL